MKEKENRTADGNAGERKYLSTSNSNNCSLPRCLQHGGSFQIPAAPTFSSAMGYEGGPYLTGLILRGLLAPAVAQCYFKQRSSALALVVSAFQTLLTFVIPSSGRMQITEKGLGPRSAVGGA
jgi:hypothetical protein